MVGMPVGSGLKSWTAALILSIAAFSASTPARALTDEQRLSADRFALGNAVWILYHEIGHLLVHEFRLPVLGREEDAVDHLATVLLLEAANRENDQYLTDAIDGFFLSARARPAANNDRRLYTGHGLDEQRAFEVVCLMIGNDPVAFGPLADSVNLPAAERERCPHAYQLARSSWFSVMDANTGGWFSRASRDSVAIHYGDADGRNRAARDILTGAEVLEGAAEFIGTSYSFPRQVTLRAEECGEANAFFEPATGDVVLCYELVEDFRALLTRYYTGL